MILIILIAIALILIMWNVFMLIDVWKLNRIMDMQRQHIQDLKLINKL
jgi:hypothetical protein